MSMATHKMERPRVLVLGGGPDAEREVSISSATAVAEALNRSGRCDARLEIVERIGLEQLRGFGADVVFPVLHGCWGEGGQLQDVLEADGRPYVGSAPRAARLAMDKAATKALAGTLGIATAPFNIFDPRDPGCPLELPVVLKPIHEGSTIGLHICKTEREWAAAARGVREESRGGDERAYMVERYIAGRELTVGLLDNRPLPVIEIRPAAGVYDYEAKYSRDDTVYTPEPDLPPGVAERVRGAAVTLAEKIGVRHLARADFLLDEHGDAWLLEINTIPGFTDHSLVPMAAKHAGVSMPDLCARLVEMALRDAGVRAAASRVQ